ncbi:MAG: hypothetical protein GX334_07210 [Firmicutes bacterium]|nr:hypothetical protein [Bacillota bacterium]
MLKKAVSIKIPLVGLQRAGHPETGPRGQSEGYLAVGVNTVRNRCRAASHRKTGTPPAQTRTGDTIPRLNPNYKPTRSKCRPFSQNFREDSQ